MCKDANAPACDRWRRVFCCFVTVGGEGSTIFLRARARSPTRDPSYKRGWGPTDTFVRALLPQRFALLLFLSQLLLLASHSWPPFFPRDGFAHRHGAPLECEASAHTSPRL